MQAMNELRTIDLNLLVVLDAVLAERHITRAAARLGLSQPAVSHALNRLRHLFGDELMVRTAGGLRPTARALELEPAVRDLIARTRRVLGLTGFDPAADRRTFRLAMSDYGSAVLLPAVLARLRREAPGIGLSVVQAGRAAMAEDVASGALDAAAGVFPHAPATLTVRRLFTERYVCLADRNHPAFAGCTLTLEGYLAAPHLAVAIGGEGPGEVETALAAIGASRRVQVVIPHFGTAQHLLPGTDLILTIAGRAVARPAAGLRVCPPPFAVAPFDFALLSHPRAGDDAALAWLLRLIAETGDRLA